MHTVSLNRAGLFLFGCLLIALAPCAEGQGRLTYQTVGNQLFHLPPCRVVHSLGAELKDLLTFFYLCC